MTTGVALAKHRDVLLSVRFSTGSIKKKSPPWPVQRTVYPTSENPGPSLDNR